MKTKEQIIEILEKHNSKDIFVINISHTTDIFGAIASEIVEAGEKDEHKLCENCNDLYDDDSYYCIKCDEDFSNWHKIKSKVPQSHIPSDEEIEKEANSYNRYAPINDESRLGFKAGAKWFKSQTKAVDVKEAMRYIYRITAWATLAQRDVIDYNLETIIDEYLNQREQ